MDKEKQFDNLIEEILSLKKRGISEAQIFEKFPEHKSEIENILKTISVLDKNRESISTSEETLSHILQNLGDFDYAKEKGRQSISAVLQTLFMKTKWKIIIPVGVVAVLVIAIFSWQGVVKSPTENKMAENLSVEEEIAAQYKNQNIDSDLIVAAILSDVDAEIAALEADSNKFSDILEANAQSINDFNEVYVENEI